MNDANELTSPTMSHVDQPESVAENRGNPLRGWENENHISSTQYQKALAQYESTRQAVLAALSDDPTVGRMTEIGREYGEAFNILEEEDPFIDTADREDLFDALDHILDEAEAELSLDLDWARESLIEGAESVRDW
ncbi:hypothetical protein [Nocardia sp. NBC_01009]|uniref:hypothetical protein n=1 Tax=Nocardia sp. NBC_01009 TaxID=2975996 RepID=UPI00386E8848|nr:hypothetical protein OHA42_24560 [Nocardia sp. NBC_01009]